MEPMNILVNDVVGLLGKIHVDESLKSVLNRLGLDASKIRLKRGDVDMNLISKEFGLEIEFADTTKYRCHENLPEGALVAGAVFFSPLSVERLGALPYEISFAMTRPSAQALLGTPTWSSPVAPTDRWSVDGREVTVRFDRETGKVQRVIFSLPK